MQNATNPATFRTGGMDGHALPFPEGMPIFCARAWAEGEYVRARAGGEGMSRDRRLADDAQHR